MTKIDEIDGNLINISRRIKLCLSNIKSSVIPSMYTVKSIRDLHNIMATTIRDLDRIASLPVEKSPEINRALQSLKQSCLLWRGMLERQDNYCKRFTDDKDYQLISEYANSRKQEEDPKLGHSIIPLLNTPQTIPPTPLQGNPTKSSSSKNEELSVFFNELIRQLFSYFDNPSDYHKKRFLFKMFSWVTRFIQFPFEATKDGIVFFLEKLFFAFRHPTIIYGKAKISDEFIHLNAFQYHLKDLEMGFVDVIQNLGKTFIHPVNSLVALKNTIKKIFKEAGNWKITKSYFNDQWNLFCAHPLRFFPTILLFLLPMIFARTSLSKLAEIPLSIDPLRAADSLITISTYTLVGMQVVRDICSKKSIQRNHQLLIDNLFFYDKNEETEDGTYNLILDEIEKTENELREHDPIYLNNHSLAFRLSSEVRYLRNNLEFLDSNDEIGKINKKIDEINDLLNSLGSKNDKEFQQPTESVRENSLCSDNPSPFFQNPRDRNSPRDSNKNNNDTPVFSSYSYT